MRYLVATIVASAMLAGTAFAATINVPGDYSTIQGAFDASSDGDTIAIAAGTYYERNLNPAGKAVLISGTVDSSGLPVTVINAQSMGSVFRCVSNETSGTVIANVVLTDGVADKFLGMGGGGAEIFNSSPTFNNCTFASNQAMNGMEGGGAHCFYSSNPRFENCRFEGNQGGSGGGIYCAYYSSATIIGCTFIANTSCYGGAICVYECDVTISGCEFIQNSAGGDFCGMPDGGAIYNYEGNVSISGCEFRQNSSLGQGGAIYGNPVSSTNVSSTLFCENVPAAIHGPWSNGGGNEFATSCPFVDSDGDGVSDEEDNCDLYNPDQADCNENGIGDVCDISDGTSQDLDGNQVPDECECIADITDGVTPGVGDGLVNVNDLLAVIANWNATGSFADINMDGTVGVDDLLIVIANWGPCE